MQSYGAPKLWESQFWQFRDCHFRDKMPFEHGPVGSHRVYYKGGGGGFPQL
jgi:hypothetical protein